ncbi:L,D-transpeptidase [Lacticaseibacillus nasuensis]|uniref:L,D-transpeptidase n=1 Tax=Lacticaseibacillus nasuensis TaxID=944671 RepID=UPI0022469977|nr:L,D-transpeptidase [Lacticaseibacillus nasuensis]MCX2455001.1 L,D-transpeptidase [Lacticaseibacillus nasuensis]
MHVIANTAINQISNPTFFLKLNREQSILKIYARTNNSRIGKVYPIRPNFDVSDYTAYDKVKSIPCIFGGECRTKTPSGIFDIQKVTTDEYISGYRPGINAVKFFGYLAIFEDYFIHSDMYPMNETTNTFRNGTPLSSHDTHTQGCIRVAQTDLDWLIEYIPVGTIIEM